MLTSTFISKVCADDGVKDFIFSVVNIHAEVTCKLGTHQRPYWQISTNLFFFDNSKHLLQ